MHPSARMLAILPVLLAARAYAEPSVGVVVIGGESVQPVVFAQTERWLRDHGHSVKPTPFGPEALANFLDCDVIEDDSCMRAVVDKRADTDSVLFARVGTSTDAKEGRIVLIGFRWFIKNGAGKNPPITTCSDCTDARLQDAIAKILAELVGDSKTAMGSVRITSRPAGLNVLIDDRPVGSTPLEVELFEGAHTISLSRAGTKVGERIVTVVAGQQSEIEIPVVQTRVRRRSRLVPGLLVGVGVLGIAGGAVLYGTSEIDDGTQPYYTDRRPAGIAVAGAGAALAITGAVIALFRDPTMESGPTAALTSEQGYIGWAGRF